MKGFEIDYNGKLTYMAVEDGLFHIEIHHRNNKGNFYAGGVEYGKQTKIAWYNYTPMSIGDRFEIKFVEIDHISEPVECVHDKTIKRPISRLDMYLGLEQYLKSKGLL